MGLYNSMISLRDLTYNTLLQYIYFYTIVSTVYIKQYMMCVHMYSYIITKNLNVHVVSHRILMDFNLQALNGLK